MTCPEVSSHKRVLLVIPCLDEASTIAAVVGSAVEEVAEVGGTVVAVDGGSTDGTREVLQGLAAAHPRLLLVDNPARLQGAGVNLAVATYGAGHDYLLRVDAHGGFGAGYAAALVAELEAQGADSVVVRMQTVATESRFQAAVARAQNSLVGTGGARHRTGQVHGRWVDHGHHALFRLAAFRAVGGYDDTFSHNEDAELDVRLRRAGYRIWMAPQPVFTYHPRRTVPDLARQYYRFGQGRARTVVRHREANLRQLAVAPVVPAVLVAVLVPRSSVARTPFVLWLLAVVTASVATARDARAAEQAQVAVAVGVMHGAWSAGFWGQLLRAASRRLGVRRSDTGAFQ